jgi:hypothetical protein
MKKPKSKKDTKPKAKKPVKQKQPIKQTKKAAAPKDFRAETINAIVEALFANNQIPTLARNLKQGDDPDQIVGVFDEVACSAPAGLLSNIWPCEITRVLMRHPDMQRVIAQSVFDRVDKWAYEIHQEALSAEEQHLRAEKAEMNGGAPYLVANLITPAQKAVLSSILKDILNDGVSQ